MPGQAAHEQQTRSYEPQQAGIHWPPCNRNSDNCGLSSSGLDEDEVTPHPALKMVVFALIPTAQDRIATIVKVRFARNVRVAYRRS
jgi:hypothetical protein